MPPSPIILPSLGELSFHIPVTPMLLLGILSLIIALWGIFTLVIHYHWKNYGTSKLEVFTMNFFYLAGSIVLIILMAAFALLYLASAS